MSGIDLGGRGTYLARILSTRSGSSVGAGLLLSEGTFVSPVPSIRATRFPFTRSFSPSVRLVFLVRNVRNGHGLAVHVHAVEQTYLDSLVNARNGLALERDPAVPKKRLGFGTLAHAVPARGVWVGWDGRVC